MFKLFNNQLLFNTPDAPVGGLTADDILNELNSVDPNEEPLELDDKPKKPISKDTDKESDKDEETTEEKETDDETEEEEKDELAELEEELAEPDPTKLELVTPAARKEILAKYPTLFKDFPALEKSYYRDLAYSEILPTIDDAKQAVAAVETLEAFETQLKSGNLESILNAVTKEDQNAFNKIVDNFLPTLAKTNEKAHLHVVGSVIQDTIVAMLDEAKTSNDEVLNSAATVLHKFIFGTTKYVPLGKLATDVKNDKSEVDEERQKFQKERFEAAASDVNTTIDNRLKATIDNNLFKAEDEVGEFVKRNAIREASEKLNKLLKSDVRFNTIVKQLWQAAAKKSFDKDSLDMIRTAHFSRAKTLLPAVLKSVRNEALKGKTQRVKTDTTNDNSESKTPTRTSTSQRTSGNETKTDKNKPLPGESSMDFMMRD